MRFESSGAATSVAVMATLFSLTTAMQILSVERRRLTIVLMYGIITAEKRIPILPSRAQCLNFLFITQNQSI